MNTIVFNRTKDTSEWTSTEVWVIDNEEDLFAITCNTGVLPNGDKHYTWCGPKGEFGTRHKYSIRDILYESFYEEDYWEHI